MPYNDVEDMVKESGDIYVFGHGRVEGVVGATTKLPQRQL